MGFGFNEKVIPDLIIASSEKILYDFRNDLIFI